MLARFLTDEGGLELLQQPALVVGQVDRRLDHALDIEIAVSLAAQMRQCGLAQVKRGADRAVELAAGPYR